MLHLDVQLVLLVLTPLWLPTPAFTNRYPNLPS
jgi:hypothetical protein